MAAVSNLSFFLIDWGNYFAWPWRSLFFWLRNIFWLKLSTLCGANDFSCCSSISPLYSEAGAFMTQSWTLLLSLYKKKIHLSLALSQLCSVRLWENGCSGLWVLALRLFGLYSALHKTLTNERIIYYFSGKFHHIACITKCNQNSWLTFQSRTKLKVSSHKSRHQTPAQQMCLDTFKYIHFSTVKLFRFVYAIIYSLHFHNWLFFPNMQGCPFKQYIFSHINIRLT